MRTIYITLFFIVNLFSVCLYAADDAARHTEQGHTYLDAGQYNEAIESYTLALQASTDNDQADDPEVLSGLGDCYKAQEQYANAIKYYAEAVQASPHDGLLSGKLGDAYIASGNVLSGTACFESAVTKLKEQVAADPTDICLLTNLGCYSQKIGAFDDAIKSLKQALSLTKDNNDKAYIQYEIGRSYQGKKEYDQAIISLAKAAQLSDVPFIKEALTECINASASIESTDTSKKVELPIPDAKSIDAPKQAKPSLSNKGVQQNLFSRVYSWLWPTPKKSDDSAQQDEQSPAQTEKPVQEQPHNPAPPSPLVPQTPTTAPPTTPAIAIDSTVPVQALKAVSALQTALVMAAGTAITLTTLIAAIRYHLLLRAQRQKLIARTIPTDGAKFASYSKKRALFAATTAALALATLGAATLLHRQSQNAAAAA